MRSVDVHPEAVHEDGNGDMVELLRARARQAARADAALLAAALAAAEAAGPGFDADEVAFALAWTQVFARRQVEFARYLMRSLPVVFAAFARGDIDAGRAWVFYDQLATVEDALAAVVAGALLPAAAGLTISQLRDRLRRAVLKADPQAAAERVRRCEADRCVAVSPDGDGTASLVGARLPAGRSMAAFERVDAYARARKHDGDVRSLDQLRADTFLDLLEGVGIGVTPVHRAGVIELTVPWDTAVGLGDQPGLLAGYGPVAATVTRDLIAAYGHQTGTEAGSDPARGAHRTSATTTPRHVRTRWRYSITAPDGTLLLHGPTRPPAPRPAPPATGLPSAARPTSSAIGRPTAATATSLAIHLPSAASPTPPAIVVSPAARPKSLTSTGSPTPRPPIEADPTRRSPSPALARWITTRDRTCRAPGCRVPARATDIDHTTDHHTGGPTSHTNLAALCRHHHRTKHDGGWTVTQPQPGHLVWTSPTGHTYHRQPDPPW